MPMSPRLLRPIQNTHPEAADWANRVRTNGGTVSGSTLAAVSRFCRSIDAAGIRDRFYRLNLFCGNSDGSLFAVRTPLYRGPSRTGTQFGNTVDTNNNFVAGDYAETGAGGGLTGNGSTKYLDTGLTVTNIGSASSGHLSVYHGQSSGSNSNRYYIAANDSTISNRFWLGTDAFSTASVLGVYSSVASASQSLASQGHGTAGHRIVSRISHTSLTHYHNGNVVATNTAENSGGAALSTAAFPVFAYNNNGTIQRYHNSWIAAYSIGLGLDGTQAADYRTALQTFMTTLGRNV